MGLSPTNNFVLLPIITPKKPGEEEPAGTTKSPVPANTREDEFVGEVKAKGVATQPARQTVLDIGKFTKRNYQEIEPGENLAIERQTDPGNTFITGSTPESPIELDFQPAGPIKINQGLALVDGKEIPGYIIEHQADKGSEKIFIAKNENIKLVGLKGAQGQELSLDEKTLKALTTAGPISFNSEKIRPPEPGPTNASQSIKSPDLSADQAQAILSNKDLKITGHERGILGSSMSTGKETTIYDFSVKDDNKEYAVHYEKDPNNADGNSTYKVGIKPKDSEAPMQFIDLKPKSDFEKSTLKLIDKMEKSKFYDKNRNLLMK